MSTIRPQVFGNRWTEKKLLCLKNYLESYNKALKNKPFNRIYIDAFAGSGSRITKDEEVFNNDDLAEMSSFSNGSASIALQIDPGFSKYIFIDNAPKNITSLEELKSRFDTKVIDIINGDANIEVDRLCHSIDWKKNRGVIFLDPFGMQVNWSTLETIAQTQAIDCWVLFPLGVAINRLLTKKSEPPQSWQNALTRVLGTDQWKARFYERDPQLRLFTVNENEHLIKKASLDDIGQFFIDRLGEIFLGVNKKPLYLRNSTNNPLYLLCFGINNPSIKARNLALRLANYIIDKEQSYG